MEKEVLKLQTWPGKRRKIFFKYKDYLISSLEEKASWFHNLINSANEVKYSYHLETVIKGSKKEGYELKVTIRKSHEKYKHKENTHKQETDI
jgi:hypothetical protein